MEKFRQQAQEWWKQWQALSAPRKLAWTFGVASCLGLAAIIWWAAQPEYRVLYADLSADQSGAITSKLESKGISYKLAAGGATILVPADKVAQVNVTLINEGLGGKFKLDKGLESFEQPMIGATPFTQHVNFLRAQSAELARTIMQIDPVVFARVHIMRPEPSPFKREQKATTASVLLKLRPGTTLGRVTVDAIAEMVSGSVEGLTKENVRIADTNGHLLTRRPDPETGAAGSIIEQKREIEQYLAGEAEHLLTAVLGQGRALVVVRVELDNKTLREKKEIISAEGKVQRSEKMTLNKTSGSAGSKGGPAGATSNLARPQTGSGGGNSTQETQESTYDYPRTVQELVTRHGTITRLTVAAFVDLDGTKKTVPMAELQETIKKAVGFKAGRDEIQVTQVNMPIVASDGMDDEWATHQRWQDILTMVRNVSIALLALCVLPIAWTIWRRLRRGTAKLAEATSPQLLRINEELDRNPEALAQLISVWIERTENPKSKKAA